MRCPACGSENEDGRQWCDFCKEPFNKKVVPKTSEAAAPKQPSSIPAEFAGLDSGERIPAVPPKLRLAAWVFFALAMLGVLALSMMAVRRTGEFESAAGSIRPEAHDE